MIQASAMIDRTRAGIPLQRAEADRFHVTLNKMGRLANQTER